MTLGNKIQKLRKENGLSQEALAEKIAVTRQTISKWELDQSEPDLSFIAQLCDIFGVSADYLIRENVTEKGKTPAPKKTFRPAKFKRMLLVTISIASLIAIFTCLICDFFTSDSLSWSIIATISIAAAWFLLLPCLTSTNKAIIKTLLILSIAPFIILASIALVYKKVIVITLGAIISLIGIAFIWLVYVIFRKYHAKPWMALGYSVLLIIPVSIAINYIVQLFADTASYDSEKSYLFNSAITVVMALVCFGINYLHVGKKEEESI